MYSFKQNICKQSRYKRTLAGTQCAQMLALKFSRRKAIGEGGFVTQAKRKKIRFEKVSVMIN